VISPTKTEDVSNMQRACLKMVETFGFQESVALGHPAAVGKFCLQAAALARDLNGTLVA